MCTVLHTTQNTEHTENSCHQIENIRLRMLWKMVLLVPLLCTHSLTQLLFLINFIRSIHLVFFSFLLSSFLSISWFSKYLQMTVDAFHTTKWKVNMDELQAFIVCINRCQRTIASVFMSHLAFDIWLVHDAPPLSSCGHTEAISIAKKFLQRTICILIFAYSNRLISKSTEWTVDHNIGYSWIELRT